MAAPLSEGSCTCEWYPLSVCVSVCVCVCVGVSVPAYGSAWYPVTAERHSQSVKGVDGAIQVDFRNESLSLPHSLSFALSFAHRHTHTHTHTHTRTCTIFKNLKEETDWVSNQKTFPGYESDWWWKVLLFGVPVHKWRGRCTLIGLHSLAAQSRLKAEGKKKSALLVENGHRSWEAGESSGLEDVNAWGEKKGEWME